jgi:hypothetical protein
MQQRCQGAAEIVEAHTLPSRLYQKHRPKLSFVDDIPALSRRTQRRTEDHIILVGLRPYLPPFI